MPSIAYCIGGVADNLFVPIPHVPGGRRDWVDVDYVDPPRWADVDHADDVPIVTRTERYVLQYLDNGQVIARLDPAALLPAEDAVFGAVVQVRDRVDLDRLPDQTILVTAGGGRVGQLALGEDLDDCATIDWAGSDLTVLRGYPEHGNPPEYQPWDRITDSEFPMIGILPGVKGDDQ